MKPSLLIPTLFAATGSLIVLLGSNPRSDFSTRIAKSKDRASTSSRLAEIGLDNPKDFESYRTKQLLNSAAIGCGSFLMTILLGNPPALALLLSVSTFSLTFVLIDRDLTKKVKKQRLMIDAEFPAAIEMFSLALSAGETPIVAMERIAVTAKGSLSREFSKVVDQVKLGIPFHLALDQMGRGLESLLIRRFVDSLIIATLRGAPLIEVLQRHAQEARESQRNRVLGAAAKAEISMMIPVVFLILPISILFALWPSLANLNLIAGT